MAGNNENNTTELFTENGSGDVALASFSGYMGFLGQMSSEFGEVAGGKINLVFAVSGGVITGVFDKNMNPEKDYEEVIGTALTGYALGETGGALGGAAAGFIVGAEGGSVVPVIGTVIGAVAGGVVGGLYGDDFYKEGKELIEDTGEFIDGTMQDMIDFVSPGFTFMDTKVYGTVSPEEFMIQSIEDNPNFCKSIYPEYENYRQIVSIENPQATLADSIRVDNTSNSVDIKASDLDTAKEYIDVVYSNNTNIHVEDKISLTVGQKEADIVNNDSLQNIVETLPENTSLTIHTQDQKSFELKDANATVLKENLTQIPESSVVLSNVRLYPDEELTINDRQTHKVASGDTFSQIAQSHDMTNKALLSKNEWLIDENRIDFKEEKILLNTTSEPAKENNQEPTYTLDDENVVSKTGVTIIHEHNIAKDNALANSENNTIDTTLKAQEIVANMDLPQRDEGMDYGMEIGD